MDASRKTGPGQQCSNRHLKILCLGVGQKCAAQYTLGLTTLGFVPQQKENALFSVKDLCSKGIAVYCCTQTDVRRRLKTNRFLRFNGDNGLIMHKTRPWRMFRMYTIALLPSEACASMLSLCCDGWTSYERVSCKVKFRIVNSTDTQLCHTVSVH